MSGKFAFANIQGAASVLSCLASLCLPPLFILCSGCNVENGGPAHHLGPSGRTKEDCQPAFAVLTTNAVEVSVDDGLRFGFKAILIGCENDLSIIDEGQRSALTKVVAEAVKENHYLLKRASLMPDFRRQQVEKMNSSLGAQLVTDVFIYGLYSVESGADPNAP